MGENRVIGIRYLARIIFEYNKVIMISLITTFNDAKNLFDL
jgi:hypothetical protein